LSLDKFAFRFHGFNRVFAVDSFQQIDPAVFVPMLGTALGIREP